MKRSTFDDVTPDIFDLSKDTLLKILDYISDGATWKATRLTSRAFLYLAQTKNKSGQLANQVGTLLNRIDIFPLWQLDKLSRYSKAVLPMHIERHFNDWDHAALAQLSPHYTYKMMVRAERALCCDLHPAFVMNAAFKWSIVEDTRATDKAWPYRIMIKKEYVTLDIVLANLDLFGEHMAEYALNTNYSWDDWLAHPEYREVWARGTPRAPITAILANPALEWNAIRISVAVPWADIKANPGLPWNYFIVAITHKELTWDDFQAPPLQGHMISAILYGNGQFVSWDIIQRHPEIDWPYKALSLCESIPMSVIWENINLFAPGYSILNRKDVTWQVIVYVLRNTYINTRQRMAEALEKPVAVNLWFRPMTTYGFNRHYDAMFANYYDDDWAGVLARHKAANAD